MLPPLLAIVLYVWERPIKVAGCVVRTQHTVAVLVAVVLPLPSARVARAAVRLSIVNRVKVSALETLYTMAESRWRAEAEASMLPL